MNASIGFATPWVHSAGRASGMPTRSGPQPTPKAPLRRSTRGGRDILVGQLHARRHRRTHWLRLLASHSRLSSSFPGVTAAPCAPPFSAPLASPAAAPTSPSSRHDTSSSAAVKTATARSPGSAAVSLIAYQKPEKKRLCAWVELIHSIYENQSPCSLALRADGGVGLWPAIRHSCRHLSGPEVNAKNLGTNGEMAGREPTPPCQLRIWQCCLVIIPRICIYSPQHRDSRRRSYAEAIPHRVCISPELPALSSTAALKGPSQTPHRPPFRRAGGPGAEATQVTQRAVSSEKDFPDYAAVSGNTGWR